MLTGGICYHMTLLLGVVHLDLESWGRGQWVGLVTVMHGLLVDLGLGLRVLEWMGLQFLGCFVFAPGPRVQVGLSNGGVVFVRVHLKYYTSKNFQSFLKNLLLNTVENKRLSFDLNCLQQSIFLYFLNQKYPKKFSFSLLPLHRLQQNKSPHPITTSTTMQQQVLDSFFYTQMLIAQHNYYRLNDQQSMTTLLRYYCDCVHYFQSKQESISNYFKLKIKELVRDIKQFGNPENASQNKEKMNKKVIRAMEQQNIQQQITKSTNRELKVQQAITKIVEGQAQNLEKRRLKRSMNKCKSVTMSFGSIDTSPESKPVNGMLKDEKYMESLKEFFGEGMQLVFDQDI